MARALGLWLGGRHRDEITSIAPMNYNQTNMGSGVGKTSSDPEWSPTTIVTRLLAWYDQHRRRLPWRAAAGAQSSPYHVLVSEIMLQQTTAATVRARFAPFLERFPDLAALAAAPEDDVLHAWQGLGYYRRARALHACARVVVERHGGHLPEDAAALMALPGLGPYTVSAIRAIAFDRPDVPVDGNVQRVMARLHAVEEPLPKAGRRLRELAQALTTDQRPGDLAQALMDLGAMICRPRAPQCDRCPVAPTCAALAAGLTDVLPRKQPKPERPTRRGVAFVLRRGDGAILFRRRPATGLLGGMHELPSSPWAEGGIELDQALAHAPAVADWRVRPGPVRHGFTHFVLELTLAEATVSAPPDGLWCRPDQLGELALPTVMQKALQAAGIKVAARPRARARSA